MTHEIGHSLGLADCYECRRGTTAMAAFKDKDKGNEVYEPSECDKYVVAAGYAGDTGMQARVMQTSHE
jgi:predicted Zn-dependent protease